MTKESDNKENWIKLERFFPSPTGGFSIVTSCPESEEKEVMKQIEKMGREKVAHQMKILAYGFSTEAGGERES